MQITYTLEFKINKQKKTKELLTLFPSGLGYLGWCHIPGA